jgi:hypothetical protein
MKASEPARLKRRNILDMTIPYDKSMDERPVWPSSIDCYGKKLVTPGGLNRGYTTRSTGPMR